MPARAAVPARATAAADLRADTLDAARRLIVARGYRAVSMRDIAAEVGCSVSSLYLYFPSRDALLHTLIDEGFQRWYDEVRRLADDHPDPWGALDAIARRYVSFGLENPELYEIMFLFHPTTMKRLPREIFRRARRGFDVMASVIAAVAPDLNEETARLTVAAIWATLHGAVSTLLASRLDTRIARDRYINAVIDSVHATVRASHA